MPDETSSEEFDVDLESSSTGVRPRVPEADEPSAADSMITASRSVVRARYPTLSQTGFHKPLPPVKRIGNLWTSIGLYLGRHLSTAMRDDHLLLIVMAAFVGVTSGAAAALLLLWIESANEFFLFDLEGGLRYFALLLVPVVGGLGAGALHWLSARYLKATPERSPVGVIGAVMLNGGRMDGRAGVVAGIGSGVTVGSGGSCGHEGPSVAIGATVGSVLAQFFGFRLRRQVALVGAGCAGGLAAAFNAPLAGVIFTVELVFGGAIGGNIGTMSVFIPLIVAAVSGTFTSHAIFGTHPEFALPSFPAPSLPEYGFYLLLAGVAGLVGALFARAITYATQRFAAVGMPSWLKPALGALGVGILAAVITSEVLGPGRGIVDAALHGRLEWQLALLLVGIKIVATALTVGSGGFGGAFMPSLFVGSCLGTMVGTLAHLALGVDQGIGAYALVGMGAVFAGMMQAPLTPIIMVFELTRDFAIILPLMLACILAVVVSRRINDAGLYRLMGRLRGFDVDHQDDADAMKRGLVQELMIAPDRVLTVGAGLEEVRQAVLRAQMNSAFVVDDDRTVLGYINGDQLARRMLDGEINPESTAEDLMAHSRLTLMHPTDTLAGAMSAFSRAGREVLAVVDGEHRLLGVLRRGDLLAHYSEKVLGREEAVLQVHAGARGNPDQEVGLGRGTVLERVVVGRSWAGKSLSELRLRSKTGCVVLEWRRGDQVVAIDPNAPLREGDLVALAGTRREILRARELF